MKVLLIVDHAPDYREVFFRRLAAAVDLTVVAKPCRDGLSAPADRGRYRYVEIPESRVAGFYWQSGLRSTVAEEWWDVVCCSINLRHIDRNSLFLTSRDQWDRWVWRGHVFGRDQSKLLVMCRGYLLRRSAGCLVYNDEIARAVRDKFNVDAVSFNNSEVSESEFRPGRFVHGPGIRLLFVGRFQKRKRLDRLVELARRREDVSVRLVGPGMEEVNVSSALLQSGRVETFGKTMGVDLEQHFDWADVIASPGHVGLLVMNAARHGKGIVVDSNSRHAPEYLLAQEAEQPFISFGDHAEEDRFLQSVRENPGLYRVYGNRLQSMARKKYTVEAMVAAHLRVFESVASHAASIRPSLLP